MYKKCIPVIFATDQRADYRCILSNNKGLVLPSTGADARRLQSSGYLVNHLHILSDDKIEEGDWCVLLDSLGGIMSKPSEYLPSTGHVLNKHLRKIIASTDISLNVPSVPQTFIKEYVDSYNKGEVINEVDVECTECTCEGWEETYACDHSHDNGMGTGRATHCNIQRALKLLDNNIIITNIKDTYSRAEVVALFRKLEEERNRYYPEDANSILPLDDFLKDNYLI